MDYLTKAKRTLAERSTEVFNAMREDLEFQEYPDHYFKLGTTMMDIDRTETWGELLQKIMRGNFDHVGMFSEDDENLEEFLVEIFRK